MRNLVQDGTPVAVVAEGYWPLVKAGFVLLVGATLVYALSRVARRVVTERFSPQLGMVAGKLLLYPGLLILGVSVMTELGFSLAPLLGAAGILGIALGFASQTSVSNIISGLFLIGEASFVVDDLIQVGDTTGRVLSIDMLSVKLRTFDNRFVRIPNESLIKTQVTNITRFPIRRVDLIIGTAYKENTARIRKVLLEVADRNPLALMEPEPQVIAEGFGDSSVNYKFAVWTTRENFLALRNALYEEVKERLDAEGIEIPFPHRTLYAGAATEPLPIQIVSGNATPSEEPDPVIAE